MGYVKIDPANCEFVTVARTEEIPVGERMILEIDGLPLVVFNLAGNYYAIGDVCSHDDGPVGEGEIEGGEIICPRHGARFEIRTGKVISLPAVVDIPSYPVQVVGDEIRVGIPIS